LLGDNQFGQLGIGTTSGNVGTPMPVKGLTGVVDVVASYDTTCALRGDGSVWCWGDNAYGQCGDGTTARRTTPVLVQLAP
jgi:alpha-tubulin suppressor-like RCC1 family protein